MTAAAKPAPPLAVEQLSVRRGGRTIFADISLRAEAGEIVGLVGKNGCGKSTLLSCVAGVLAPRDGRVMIGGASIWGTRRDRQRARAAIGYVPEAADPPGFLRASELWALCAAARGVELPGRELIASLGLDELAELTIERMSLGQRRRGCLGAAMLGPPQLLVLDEPDNGLDARRAEALEALLRAHAATGRACIIASHDAGMIDRVGARIVRLESR